MNEDRVLRVSRLYLWTADIENGAISPGFHFVIVLVLVLESFGEEWGGLDLADRC